MSSFSLFLVACISAEWFGGNQGRLFQSMFCHLCEVKADSVQHRKTLQTFSPLKDSETQRNLHRL